ncbi:MAG: sensor histidine kinase, partial [Omnitrophica WOR_2 bacterium]
FQELTGRMPPRVDVPSNISRWFLKNRWIVMLFVSIVVIIIEIDEHQPVNLKQFDPNLAREVFLFGVLLPLSWGLMLTMLSYAEGERIRAYDDLDRQQQLGQQLSKTSEWRDLTEKIVQFPRTVLPVIGTALHVYNPDNNRFELEAEWAVDGKSHASLTPILSPATCQTCDNRIAESNANFFFCSNANANQNSGGYRRYCVPLIYRETTVAFLHLDYPSDVTLTSGQVRIIKTAASEMAMAIEGARLQSAAAVQAEATEAERRRIAQNLHDMLGQNVSYLRLKLDQLTGDDALLEISIVKQELERMRAIAEDAYQQVRGTLADLHLSSSTDLSKALAENARAIGSRANFKVHTSVDGTPRKLPPDTMRQVLFIEKEALNNIEKHARATEININLRWEEQCFSIGIQDNGAGFDLSSVNTEGHYGLTIMQQRAAEIQGSVHILSKPGNGTSVVIEAPFQPAINP